MSTTTDTPAVTGADVHQAEREAREAVALVDALEQRVVNGDETVTHDEIEQARSLGRFAKLRAQATARKAEQTRAAARLATLERLAEQMRARHSDAGHIIDLMLQMEAATAALIELCGQRNTDFTEWIRAMVAQGVPQDGIGAEHGRVGWRQDGTVVVDGRELRPAQPAQFITAALRRAARQTGDPLVYAGQSIINGLPYGDGETATDSDAYRAQLERWL
jgi:hypothetical protein